MAALRNVYEKRGYIIMNKSEMEEIKESLKIDLDRLENDIYRLQGMLAMGKAAIRIDDCEQFERLINIMSQIDDNLQCVVVFPED